MFKQVRLDYNQGFLVFFDKIRWPLADKMASDLNKIAEPITKPSEVLSLTDTDISTTGAKYESLEFLARATIFTSGSKQASNATLPPKHQPCETCSTLDFEPLFSKRGFRSGKVLGKLSVGTVFANKTCPSCRLIAYLIASDAQATRLPGDTCAVEGGRISFSTKL